MALARYTLRAAAMNERRPSRILGALNHAVIQQVSDGRFCTVCYTRLKPGVASARLTVACGGHPLPIVVRAHGKAELAGVPGSLLGIFQDAQLHDDVVDLAPGDTLVLYTDGVTERRGPDGPFGEDHLVQTLRGCAGLRPGDIVGRLVDAVRGYGPDLPKDDIAVVVMQVGSSGGRSARSGFTPRPSEGPWRSP
jgi:serine phosphatase RsbU (regulator of sigma subunit)